MKKRILNILASTNKEEAEKKIGELLDYAINEAYKLKKAWDENGFGNFSIEKFNETLKSILEADEVEKPKD